MNTVSREKPGEEMDAPGQEIAIAVATMEADREIAFVKGENPKTRMKERIYGIEKIRRSSEVRTIGGAPMGEEKKGPPKNRDEEWDANTSNKGKWKSPQDAISDSPAASHVGARLHPAEEIMSSHAHIAASSEEKAGGRTTGNDKGTHVSNSSKVYVAGISDSTTKEKLRLVFGRYGRVSYIWLARNPPRFAFIAMESAEEAQRAIRGLDGTDIEGSRIKVETETGSNRREGNRKSEIMTRSANEPTAKIKLKEPIAEQRKERVMEEFFPEENQKGRNKNKEGQMEVKEEIGEGGQKYRENGREGMVEAQGVKRDELQDAQAGGASSVQRDQRTTGTARKQGPSEGGSEGNWKDEDGRKLVGVELWKRRLKSR